MKMFRGMTKEHIARRLVLRGWPEPAAEKMATFLCGGHEIPRWEDLVEPKPTAGER